MRFLKFALSAVLMPACIAPLVAVANEPSDVITISNHPQLFLDDFLVARMADIRRELQRPTKHPANPLIARVAVNRYWQSYFGTGLVKTVDDFGSQGEAPSHPDLLDWLASEFVARDWDVKAVQRLIVTSATYRQTSSATADAYQRDPDNRLLARGPRLRLPAEMIRDQALAVSGLLVEQLGGPSAKPYQPPGLWTELTGGADYEQDHGAGLYRRSLYTYWKRTGPAPVMMTLDASKRDVCRVRRERTASPLQAFVLLNDPQFVEAARVLAQRLIAAHGENDSASLVDLFRVLTSRRPSDAEAALLRSLLQQQARYFEQHPDRAQAFLKTGDAPRDDKLPAARLAAMAVVASTVMSFDECVMKR